MVTAIIAMNVERGKVNEVAEKLADMEGISEVYSVSGSHDLVAIARVASNEKLSDLVTQQMQKLEAIQKTETMTRPPDLFPPCPREHVFHRP